MLLIISLLARLQLFLRTENTMEKFLHGSDEDVNMC